MNWDAAGAIGELVGAAAVIATLVYLASQIRQAERTTRASIRHSSRAHGQELFFAGMDGDMAALLVKGSGGYAALEPVERLRVGLYLGANFNWYEDIFEQARDGAVDAEYWTTRQRTTLRSLLEIPGIREWWLTDRDFFTEEFRSEVDHLLAVQQAAAADGQQRVSI